MSVKQVSKGTPQAYQSEELTSPENRSLPPVHSQQHSCPQTDTLRKINTPPQIHRRQATSEVQTIEIEDRSISNVRQTSHVPILESLVHRLIQISISNLIDLHPRRRLRELVELPTKVDTLLIRTLCGRGKGREFAVDLLEELTKLAEIERAALVFVVRFEQLV